MPNTEPNSRISPQQRPSAEGGVRTPRRQRMRLPFDDRKQDSGEWAYDHRLGLSVVVIAYLVLGIVFFASKIVIGSKPHMQGIYVDLQTLAELEAEKERLQREIEMKRQSEIDWSEVRNLQSNDAMLNENLKDDRGTQTAELNRAAEEAEARMAANRKAYEEITDLEGDYTKSMGFEIHDNTLHFQSEGTTPDNDLKFCVKYYGEDTWKDILYVFPYMNSMTAFDVSFKNENIHQSDLSI